MQLVITNADSDTQLSALVRVLAIPNGSFDSSQTVTELVQKMVQNQAKVTQLAPATNEKSSCLHQLHRQHVASRSPHRSDGRPPLQTAWGHNGVGAGASAQPKHRLWDSQGLLRLKGVKIYFFSFFSSP